MSRIKASMTATQDAICMERRAYEAASAAHMAVMDQAPDPSGTAIPCPRCEGKCILPQYHHREHLGVPGGCFRCDCRGSLLEGEAAKILRDFAQKAELARLRALWSGLNKARSSRQSEDPHGSNST